MAFDPVNLALMKKLGGGSAELPWGETTTVKEVLAECQPEYVDGLGFVIAGRCSLAVGGKYIVNYNGVDYECVGVDGAELNAPGSVFLGNTYALTGGGMTHMDKRPFYLAYVTEEDVVAVAPLDGSTTLTISIRQEVTEVKKISGKYVEGMGWSETAVLLKESEAEAYTHPSFGKAWLIENAPKLSVGEIYTVVYNGVEYECLCGSAPSGFSSDPDAVAMGNFSVAGGTDTGEPFAMLISHAQNRVDIIDLSGAGEVKAKIYKETTHLIDQKFLGGQDYYYYSTPDCVLYKNVALTDAVTIDDMENVLACGRFREVYDGNAGGNIRFVGGAFFNPAKTKGFKVTTISVGSDGAVNHMDLKSSDYKSAAPA